MITQDFTNTFKNVSVTPYSLIAASDGCNNITLPDGTVTGCNKIKRELGYPQLFAWNLQPTQLLEWVKYLKENPDSPCRLVVDSGAFSVWSKGKLFDIDEYINFLNSNDVIETAFWVAEADVIPGKMNVDPTEEERREAPEKSWQNYLYMIERVKMPKKVVPIFHMGEDLSHLQRMLEYKFKDGDHIPYIGISPRNDVHVKEKIKWYEQVWKVIRESSNPNVLTHNFGMTTISLIEQFPSFSSDSSSWVKSAAYGSINIIINGRLKTVYASNRALNDPSHLMNQSPAVIEAVEEACKRMGHGMCVKELVEEDHGYLKQAFNLFILNEWRSTFKYEGNDMFKESLW